VKANRAGAAGKFKMLAILLITLVAMLFGTVAYSQAQPSNSPSSFDVVSIRENNSASGWGMRFLPNGLSAKATTLQYLIEEAYGVYDPAFMQGGPKWIASRQFDVEARYEADGGKEISMDARKEMLRRLLAERFAVRLHSEMHDVPSYALVIWKNGPKLDLTQKVGTHHEETYGDVCLHRESRPGFEKNEGCTLDDLAFDLSMNNEVGRPVINRTGLTARYSFELKWSIGSADKPDDNSAPSIFSAVKEQLGLELQSIKAPHKVIVIDSASLPSQN
jgi:uncharacterized protein (TIGR03435 family)